MCVFGEVRYVWQLTQRRGSSWVTAVAFLCVHAHRREASVVIEPLGPVSLIMDVVGDFFEVLKMSPEGHSEKEKEMQLRVGR